MIKFLYCENIREGVSVRRVSGRPQHWRLRGEALRKRGLHTLLQGGQIGIRVSHTSGFVRPPRRADGS